MTKLTTERLEELANATTPSVKYVGREIIAMARQILAYEQAAKNPVAWVVGDEEIADFKNGREVCVMRDCDDEQLDYLPLYAEPVLPKQPEPVALIFENHAYTELYKLEEIEIAQRMQKEVGGTITELFKGMPARSVIPKQPVMFIDGDISSIPENIPAQPVSEPYKLPDGWKLVPFDPAKEMFCFVRDWSIKGVGNDQATGCNQAMLSAPAQESE